MAITLQTQSGYPLKLHPLVKSTYRVLAPFQRFWWHVHAYSVILGILIITLFSILVLYVHDQFTRVQSTLRDDFHFSVKRHHLLLVLTSLLAVTLLV